ncbi:hypothetical protein SAMN04489712_11160 [Thermomonospora echinospora]|uniref:Uncharacterized protein n=1 Tax=Thermomonospora echinospora TaxID=1992 RepID=A0A1H6CRI0_9ACTN|nr:hypothetical protein [Thermomonospora echinospora]SEG75591.1 hypothetical protein SAMN04489712_11160 [Thermomonospora echinospora]
MNGGLVGLLVGGTVGVLWGAVSGTGVIGNALLGTLVGSWLGLVVLSKRRSG